jgi:hypothetical protein
MAAEAATVVAPHGRIEPTDPMDFFHRPALAADKWDPMSEEIGQRLVHGPTEARLPSQKDLLLDSEPTRYPAWDCGK